jgi:hypothetical protein
VQRTCHSMTSLAAVPVARQSKFTCYPSGVTITHYLSRVLHYASPWENTQRNGQVIGATTSKNKWDCFVISHLCMHHTINPANRPISFAFNNKNTILLMVQKTEKTNQIFSLTQSGYFNARNHWLEKWTALWHDRLRKFKSYIYGSCKPFRWLLFNFITFIHHWVYMCISFWWTKCHLKRHTLDIFCFFLFITKAIVIKAIVYSMNHTKLTSLHNTDRIFGSASHFGIQVISAFRVHGKNTDKLWQNTEYWIYIKYNCNLRNVTGFIGP